MRRCRGAPEGRRTLSGCGAAGRVCKWVIALVFAAVLLVSALYPHGPHEGLATGAGTVALVGIDLVGLLALLWRPRHPLGVVVLTAGLVIAANLVSGPRFNGDPLALEVAASYSLVLRRPVRSGPRGDGRGVAGGGRG